MTLFDMSTALILKLRRFLIGLSLVDSKCMLGMMLIVMFIFAHTENSTFVPYGWFMQIWSHV